MGALSDDDVCLGRDVCLLSVARATCFTLRNAATCAARVKEQLLMTRRVRAAECPFVDSDPQACNKQPILLWARSCLLDHQGR